MTNSNCISVLFHGTHTAMIFTSEYCWSISSGKGSFDSSPVHQVKRTKGCLVIGLYLTSFCTPDFSVYIKPHNPILIHDKSEWCLKPKYCYLRHPACKSHQTLSISLQFKVQARWDWGERMIQPLQILAIQVATSDGTSMLSIMKGWERGIPKVSVWELIYNGSVSHFPLTDKPLIHYFVHWNGACPTNRQKTL